MILFAFEEARNWWPLGTLDTQTGDPTRRGHAVSGRKEPEAITIWGQMGKGKGGEGCGRCWGAWAWLWDYISQNP